jgi:hypothetical protein
MDTNQLTIFLQYQGFSDQASDDFLEHYGTAGMRWGVRNSKSTQSSSSNRTKSNTNSEKSKSKMSESKKVAIVGGIMLAGTALAAILIKRNSNLKISDINKRLSNVEASRRLIDANGGIKLENINKAYREKKITTKQAYKLTDLTYRNINNKLGRAAVDAGVNPKDRFGLTPRTILARNGPRQLFSIGKTI